MYILIVFTSFVFMSISSKDKFSAVDENSFSCDENNLLDIDINSSNLKKDLIVALHGYEEAYKDNEELLKKYLK